MSKGERLSVWGISVRYLFHHYHQKRIVGIQPARLRATCNQQPKKSSGRVLLIHFFEVVLMFKSSVVLSLVESVESVLKTDRLAVVSYVRISRRKGARKKKYIRMSSPFEKES
jgi:hypothetical protein